jgi:hypothetical protein
VREPHPNRHVGVPRRVLGNEGRPRGACRTGFGTPGSPRTTLDGYLRLSTVTKRELEVALGTGTPKTADLTTLGLDGRYRRPYDPLTMVYQVGNDPRDYDLQLVLDNERRLLDPQVRQSADHVDRLLHPDFFEFGASGRRWSRHEMMAALVAEGSLDGVPLTVSDFAAVRLSDDVVLVTYLTKDVERRVRRSSLWRRTELGWRLYFHQGTVIPAT